MGLPAFNTRRSFDYGQLIEGVYRLAVEKHGDNPLGLKIGGNMILKDFVIKETTTRCMDTPRMIDIFANVILQRPGKLYSIPIRIQSKHKNNGSYPENYKLSIEQFMKECERVTALWKVDPSTDIEWRPYISKGSVNMQVINKLEKNPDLDNSAD